MAVSQAYKWRDRRNAVGFAAECARAVLSIFETERPNDDRPRRAIELADAYARGEAVDPGAAGRAARAAYAAHAAHAAHAAADAAYAAHAAHAAADAAYAALAADVDDTAYAADYAKRADPTLDTDLIQAHWILRDLYGGDVPVDRLEPALGALSVSIELAQEVLTHRN